MKKTKVVIASILKPIDDSRMFEKFGLSLEQANKYEINIIGFTSKNIPTKNEIQFHPLKPFKRLSFKRILARTKVWKTYIKVKPQIIIVNTHELLILTILYRILFGGKIVYDIRENYARNVRLQQVYPFLLRPLISLIIRLKEWITQPFIKVQIIAERSYLTELPFLRNNTILLENKYKELNVLATGSKENSGQIRLLYSGTIAETYGVFDAIELAKKLNAFNPKINLTIIGYCAKMDDLMRLKAEIKDIEYINLRGGDHLVPHSEIVATIKASHFGLILNQPNKLSDKKLPTRLFEYTANHLPVLCINNPNWINFLSQFNAEIEINLKHYKPESLLVTMQNGIFYNQGDTSTSFWKSEEPKLLQLIESL
jgi:glycosyltransferase involved in cell wall biosynthesis